MKIAFFDSGIGGLTVLNEALQLYPNEDYIYFADSDYAPYGARSQREVKELITNAVAFLAQQEIDALVLACHTASRLMGDTLQAQYDFPVIGMETGLKKSHFENWGKKILVCGTDLSTSVWEKQFQYQAISANYLSLQQLIVFAEKGLFDAPQAYHYLYQKLAPFEWSQYQAILLGCTHFPFFKTHIQNLLPTHIHILDGGYLTAQKLRKYVQHPNQKRKGSIQYFISGKPQVPTYFSNYLANIKQKSNLGLARYKKVAFLTPMEKFYMV